VVCTGNLCRSPVAEGLLRDALAERFAEETPPVSSAGTIGWEGSAATPESVEAAGERGCDIAGHTARRLTAEMVDDADLVVAMAREHRAEVAATIPRAIERTFTLKELVRLLERDPIGSPEGPETLGARVASAAAVRGQGDIGNPHDEDVVDPLGMPLETYRAIAWELESWCARLVVGLFGPIAEEAG
jgi:protein-tyrosine phosphatase